MLASRTAAWRKSAILLSVDKRDKKKVDGGAKKLITQADLVKMLVKQIPHRNVCVCMCVCVCVCEEETALELFIHSSY